jgi:hypothetical protein
MQDNAGSSKVGGSIGIAQLERGGISIARKHLVNALYASPGERFYRVREALKLLETNGEDISDWDLICFAGHILLTFAPAFGWLGKDRVIELCQDINFAHYYDPDTNCGIDGRRKINTDETSSGPSTENPVNTEGREHSRTEQTGEQAVSDETGS